MNYPDITIDTILITIVNCRWLLYSVIIDSNQFARKPFKYVLL